MATALDDKQVPVTYAPKFREWGLAAGGDAIQAIDFCPWCGARLPASLRDAYFDELEAAGLEVDSPSLPLHLRSDAWWRGRSD